MQNELKLQQDCLYRHYKRLSSFSPSKFSSPFRAFLLVLCACVIFQVMYFLINYENNLSFGRRLSIYDIDETLAPPENPYLVNSLKCKIPNTNPFNTIARQYFQPLKYVPCSNLTLLSYITRNKNTATLHIDKKMIAAYSKHKITCCYANITRQQQLGPLDDDIHISRCRIFQLNVTIQQEYIMVKCRSRFNKTIIYENTHATFPLKASVKSRLERFRANTSSSNSTKASPFSVHILGIDSISRLNLIRTLPETYRFLEANNWISLKGYNKIADNTFPNLMAILTGFNPSQAGEICNLTQTRGLDRCPFVWKRFQEKGYITAYAEDEVSINTFNYEQEGFHDQPTDYYFRPLMLASEKMKTVRRDKSTYCVGPETYGEKVMNLARDFARVFRGYPSFGLFWMNTFSHNNVNGGGMMDEKVQSVLSDLSGDASSIVVFLSDHGSRFGSIRYTYTGWLEERLPFLYIFLPERFQLEFPKEYENLKSNTNKLTTPYDLYMSLQHILTLSSDSDVSFAIEPSLGCPKCTSLLNGIDGDGRGCEDVGVGQHWCTCSKYTSIGLRRRVVKQTRDYVVMQLRKLTKMQVLCAEFSVRRVMSVAQTEKNSASGNKIFVLIVIETKPQAFFEATVLYEKKKNETRLELQGPISRLDSYGEHSRCISESFLKKYCYCDQFR